MQPFCNEWVTDRPHLLHEPSHYKEVVLFLQASYLSLLICLMASVFKIQSTPFCFNPLYSFLSPVQRGESNSKLRAMNGVSNSSTFLVKAHASSHVTDRMDSRSMRSIFFIIVHFKKSSSFSKSPDNFNSF